MRDYAAAAEVYDLLYQGEEDRAAEARLLKEVIRTARVSAPAAAAAGAAFP